MTTPTLASAPPNATTLIFIDEQAFALELIGVDLLHVVYVWILNEWVEIDLVELSDSLSDRIYTQLDKTTT